MEGSDSYKTLATPSEGSVRERGSRFLGYAWPVGGEGEALAHVEVLRKRFHDATHVCYAWRLGGAERANDAGEPSGTAGRPIMGQILSRGLDNVLVVVVRYFGGTKLGVPGLIAAYRAAAAAALDAATPVERTVDVRLRVRFGWAAMNDVMRIVKEMSPVVGTQSFDNECVMELSIRRSLAEELFSRLAKFAAAEVL